MPLRRLHRILGAVLTASLAIAAGDGLLCLIPCAASTVQVERSLAVQETAQGGHCATQGVPLTQTSSSAQPQNACATDQAIAEWVGERATSRASVDRETAEAVVTLSHGLTRTPAGVTPGHLATTSSPPVAFVPLRI